MPHRWLNPGLAKLPVPRHLKLNQTNGGLCRFARFFFLEYIRQLLKPS
jgi:hypothetical protein